ncbi:MAG: hypothetical protein CVV64_16830 [Candidatus Wallbacteria bacterium HGW-Wallbacteria-1]|uniref:Alginate export domain-containing protein n=1 Tax=Candidatus Wallbacteria bacterium HGW-Wallbacteria-1 TaxID=2013854 RepID=A0A2N1PKQ6_9BACT|nr:MAG: hypothetical protein CVV64_16830 [Candidatus Wallbacteria bacterium HGW-Wallbacteria-1]
MALNDSRLFSLSRTALLRGFLAVSTILSCFNPSPCPATDNLDIHGFISQGYIKSSSNNFLVDSAEGSYQFNEIGLNFSTQLKDDLRLGMQLLSRDLGRQGNNDVNLDWAFGDFRWRDWMGFRFGKMKTPMNLHNETRDIDFLRTPILLPQGVYDESLRDITQSFQGLGIYGNVPVGQIGDFDYDLILGSVNVPGNGGIAKYFEDLGLFSVDSVAAREVYGVKCKWNTSIDGFALGFSKQRYELRIDGTILPKYALVFNPAQAVTPALPIPGYPAMPWLPVAMQVDFNVKSEYEFAEYVKGSWTFSGEKWRTYGPYTLTPGLPAAMGKANPSVRKGSYWMASYRHNRLFEWSWYFNRFTDYKPAISWGAKTDDYWYLKDYCMSLKYDAAENWLVKGEIHRMTGAGMMLSADNPQPRDPDWWLYAFKTTYSY